MIKNRNKYLLLLLPFTLILILFSGDQVGAVKNYGNMSFKERIEFNKIVKEQEIKISSLERHRVEIEDKIFFESRKEEVDLEVLKELEEEIDTTEELIRREGREFVEKVQDKFGIDLAKVETD